MVRPSRSLHPSVTYGLARQLMYIPVLSSIGVRQRFAISLPRLSPSSKHNRVCLRKHVKRDTQVQYAGNVPAYFYVFYRKCLDGHGGSEAVWLLCYMSISSIISLYRHSDSVGVPYTVMCPIPRGMRYMASTLAIIRER